MHPSRDRGAYAQITGQGFGGELNVGALTTSQVTHPSDTITMATKYDSDALKASGGAVGNVTQFQCGGVLDGVPTTDGSNSYDVDWCGGEQIPNGLIPLTVAFPEGQNGSISQIRQGLSNFSMSDTHAKALTISSTDPNPDNHPELNKYDALRP